VSRAFVDTNVLVYASRSTAHAYLQANTALAHLEGEGTELCVNRQVLREYLVTTTRPQADAASLALEVAVADVRRLIGIYTVLEDGPAVTKRLLELVARYPTRGKQVHDANLVATMLAHGVTRLLTFNAGDFRRFGALVEVVAP
jgi:predicted nucleic acid-binding protein